MVNGNDRDWPMAASACADVAARMPAGEFSIAQSGYLDCHRVAACEQGRPGVPALSTRVPVMGTPATVPAVPADAATVLFGITRRRVRGSRNEVRDLLQVVERDLADNAAEGLSAHWRMNIAYNAVRAGKPPLDQARGTLVAERTGNS